MPTNKDKRKDRINGREVRSLEGASASLDGYLTFDLPTRTGSVSVRKMSGNEQNILVSRDNRKDPIGAFYDLVSNCTKGLPTTIGAKSKVETINWKKVWQDDFTFILFLIRRLTYGDLFTFGVDCPGCGKEYDWTEDLETTEVFYASNQDAQVFSSDNPTFEFRLPISGIMLTYEMPNAYHNHLIYRKRLDNRDQIKTEALRECVIAWDEKSQRPFAQEWADLSAADLQFFEQELGKHSCGINKTIEPTCDHCGHIASNFDLPVEGADFLLVPRDLALKEGGILTVLWESTPQQNKSKPKSSDLPSSIKVQASV